eukprot:TRINITY_DN21035_c0_g1_i1.p1 TRINITY_DN21035_c0_g1~~TRINITY_DN21035_c0_g1_i1.p1  ORF type:complete len:132 (-),score=40.05 TRINITY_DN21035_c0_g1_i1:193-531(-)
MCIRDRNIFEDADFDNTRSINLEKSIKFNKFVEEEVEDQLIERDAKDFINSCAIINKVTVNQDEWLFSFAKLLVCDSEIYDKFIQDYEKAVEKNGKMRGQNQSDRVFFAQLF